MTSISLPSRSRSGPLLLRFFIGLFSGLHWPRWYLMNYTWARKIWKSPEGNILKRKSRRLFFSLFVFYYVSCDICWLILFFLWKVARGCWTYNGPRQAPRALDGVLCVLKRGVVAEVQGCMLSTSCGRTSSSCLIRCTCPWHCSFGIRVESIMECSNFCGEQLCVSQIK